MQELHLVGMTRDLDGLIFSVRKGSKSGSFVVPIDLTLIDTLESADRLRREAAAAGAGGYRSGRSTAPRQESLLTPREMQARLRAGHTLEEVARAAGVHPEWVERFEAPVAAERTRVVETALGMSSSKARVGESALPLAESVRVNLHDKGIAQAAELDGWTAMSLDGTRWLVRYEYVSRQRPQKADWEMDFETRTLTPRNRTATELGYVNSARRRLPPPPVTRVPAVERNETPPRPLTMALPVIETPEREEEEFDSDQIPSGRNVKATPRRSPAKKSAAKKSAAKKSPAKRSTAKKSTAKKSTARKAVAKRPAAKKAAAKKAAVRRTPARKSPAKTVARRTAASRTTPRKAAKRTAAARRATARPTPRKTTARKTTARKTTARKTTARPATSRKTVARKTSTRKAAARKAAPRKVTARKVAARKVTARKTTARRPAARKATARTRSGRPRAEGTLSEETRPIEVPVAEAALHLEEERTAPVEAPTEPAAGTTSFAADSESIEAPGHSETAPTTAPDVVIRVPTAGSGRVPPAQPSPTARPMPAVYQSVLAASGDETAEVPAVRTGGWRRFTRPLRSR